MALITRYVPLLTQRADWSYIIARFTPIMGDVAQQAEKDAMHLEPARGRNVNCGCDECVVQFGTQITVEDTWDHWFPFPFDASQIDDLLYPYAGPDYPYHHVGDP